MRDHDTVECSFAEKNLLLKMNKFGDELLEENSTIYVCHWVFDKLTHIEGKLVGYHFFLLQFVLIEDGNSAMILIYKS